MQPIVHVCAHIIDLELNARLSQFCALQGWSIVLWDSREDVSLSLKDLPHTADLVLVDRADEANRLAVDAPQATTVALVTPAPAPDIDGSVLVLDPDDSDQDFLAAITTRLNVNRLQSHFAREREAEPITKLPRHDELLQSIARLRGDPMGLVVVQVDHAQYLYGNLDPVSKTDLLGALSDHLQHALPHECIVGIFDASCFAVWIPHSCAEVTAQLAHDLCIRGRDPLAFKSGELHCSFSIGFAHAAAMDDPNGIWRMAWGYKEQARLDGGDQAIGPDGDADDRIPRAIPDALSRDEFSLVLQPQWRLDGNELSGVEALLRWQGLEVGNLAPDHFIPVAERSGQMARIGDWVLEHACRAASTWLEHLVTPVLLGINVSAQQFKNDTIKQQIRRLQRERWLDPSVLELELSHTNLLHLVDQHRTTLYELRDAGVRIAIDNVGAGIVDTDKLLRCPADTLKIDRSVISVLETDQDAQRLVAQIAELGQRFELRIVAVGVENEAQRAILEACGCTDAQGYLFAEPVPLEDFAAFLREHGERESKAADG
jgi:EAL domain-containing protein (putative c-di-GMP-specific phosphodiesterase class I)/GGDEF domain-containing protein